MKITLTKSEAVQILTDTLQSPIAPVTVEIVDALVSVEERKNAMNLQQLTDTLKSVAPSSKIDGIKKVRQWFSDNGLSVGLAETKDFVEAVLERAGYRS